MINLKFCKIDIDNSTKEEIELEIERLTKLMNDEENSNQGLKILLNSSYGAVGNKFFVAYNPDVAEAVTLQGQDIIKFSATIVDDYFHEFWHKDYKLHKKLGISNVKQISDAISTIIYIDTDSLFITFTNAMNSCDFHGDNTKFILDIYNYRLKSFFEKYLEKYAKKYGVENLQNFELEKIVKSGIWLAKKKYVIDIVWKDPDITYKSLSKITYKGVEIVQKSTPKFAREKLKFLIEYIFEKEHSDLKITNIVSYLKTFKEEFKLEDMSNISFLRGVSDYEKYILNDKDNLVIEKSCPIHVRAAGIYNYNLNLNKKYKNKYHFIHSSDKVKYYYVKDSKTTKFNIFGYLDGDFPIEFAPEFDYDIMFKKTIIDPINRFMKVLNIGLVPDNLVTAKQLW